MRLVRSKKLVRSAQWRQASAYSALIFYCVLFFYCALISCSPPPQDENVFEITELPRLTKYYPEINAAGDTTGFHRVPVQSFVNQFGDTFYSNDVNGKISVIHFFFASCEGICPVISNNVFDVQRAFKGNDNVKLISYSVDPERDSVAVLRKYADRFKCDSSQWNLLTGEKKKIYDLARYGYLLPAIEPGTGDSEDFIHSDQLVLVDRNSIIRGYYTGTDTSDVRLLIEDISTLLKEK